VIPFPAGARDLRQNFPVWLWDTSDVLPSGYRRLLPRDKAAGIEIKIASVPPLPHMS
jgi:hypothetical protein